MRFAIMPLQWWATEDGWLDFGSGPALPELAREVATIGFTAISAGITPDLDVEAYRAALTAAGLAWAPGYFSGPLADPSARPEFVARAEGLARAHAALGLTELYVATNMVPTAARVQRPSEGVEADEKRLHTIAESLRLVCEVVNKHGVTPCLHQHVGTWIEKEHEFEFMLDAIDAEELALGPDTGHMAWAEIDPVAFIARHADRVRTVHVKDVRLDVAAKGRVEGLSYKEVVKAGLWAEPGRGDLDLASALAPLTSKDIWAIIEVDRPDLPTPVESARACAEWVRTAETWRTVAV